MNKKLYDSRLSHLSDSELEQLINDYKLGMPGKELITKYKIKATVSELSRILPPVMSEDICPYCGIKMYRKVSRKEKETPSFCAICSHESVSNCSCSACQKKTQLARLVSEKQRQLTPANKIVSIDKISQENKLRFSCFLFAYPYTNDFLIKPPTEHYESFFFMATSWFSFLCDKKIIYPIITPENAELDVDHNPLMFDYKINICQDITESLLSDAIYDNQGMIHDSETIVSVWVDIVDSLLKVYIVTSITTFSDRIDDYNVIWAKLSLIIASAKFSLMQLINFVDIAITQTDKHFQTITDSECTDFPDAADVFSKIFFTLANDEIFAESSPLLSSKTIPDSLRLLIPQYFFLRFLKNPMDGYTKVPSEDYLKECYQ